MPSILAGRPRGSILKAPEPARDPEYDFSGLPEQLYDSLTGPQKEVYDAPERFKLLCSGRRFGKTYLCITRLINWAIEKPGSLNWFVTANYRMAKQIAWRQLRALVPSEVFLSKNEAELSIELKNGSVLSLKGADNPDSLRGVSLSALVVDEAAYVRQDAWEMVLRPALSDQGGPAWFITTPSGLNWFYDLWESAENHDDWTRFTYTTIEGGNVPAEEIEAAKRTLDSRTFRQEYLASFETLTGRVFPDFDHENIDNVEDTGGGILVGLDFNVGVMAGVIASRVGDTLHIWDEIAVKNSNTSEVAKMLRERFPGREIIVYPDPTGSARKTSASGVTDHGILRQYGLKVIAPRQPWLVKDRLNATNFLICNAEGQRRMLVNPKCVNTIKGFKSVTFKQGAEEFVVDKTPGLEHWNDAAGYLILSALNKVHPFHITQTQAQAARIY